MLIFEFYAQKTWQQLKKPPQITLERVKSDPEITCHTPDAT